MEVFMSIHIGAEPGQIAKSVLLPGDPLRAKHIAETFLEDTVCFNTVRNMLGFTGTYEGKRVSVMGTGMGIPSHSIYVNELLNDYGAKTLIRVGTCGALQPDLEIGDIVLALSASTDSQVNRLRFNGMDFAPTASFDLLQKAYATAKSLDLDPAVGGILSSDTFYNDTDDWWEKWADFGILVVEMEAAGLYTLAAKYKAQALAILTVSDNIITGTNATSEQREKGFMQMAKVALMAALN
jgi:purine-nucleoside phosphorylase